MDNIDFSTVERELDVARVKRKLFSNEVEVQKRKMNKPIKKKLEVESAILDYQKKHSYLKKIVYEKYYHLCVDSGKHFLHEETGFLFDKRTKGIVGKRVGNLVVDLSADEWQLVFERLIVAQYQYKNPCFKKRVFNTLLKKKVEIIKRHETLGYFIHEPTALLFDCKTKQPIGKLDETGHVLGLTAEDWDVCVATFGNVFSRPVQ